MNCGTFSNTQTQLDSSHKISFNPRKTFPATPKNGDNLLGSSYKGAVPADLHLPSVATRVVLAQRRRASRAVAAQLTLQQRGGS